MKEPMKLEIKNGGIRGPRLVLDGKELHHVKGYEINAGLSMRSDGRKSGGRASPRPKKMKKLWGTGDRGGGSYPEKF